MGNFGWNVTVMKSCVIFDISLLFQTICCCLLLYLKMLALVSNNDCLNGNSNAIQPAPWATSKIE
jgi:hypothetical protein